MKIDGTRCAERRGPLPFDAFMADVHYCDECSQLTTGYDPRGGFICDECWKSVIAAGSYVSGSTGRRMVRVGDRWEVEVAVDSVAGAVRK